MPTTPTPVEAERAAATGTVVPARHLARPDPASWVAGEGWGIDEPGTSRVGSGMQERVVNGRRATNRAGAAEYLGRSPQTINLVASPKRRAATGWPNPLPDRVDGQEWYAFDDLDAFRVSYLEAKQRARRAKVHEITLGGDPDEMVSAKDFRALIGVEHNVWSKYVEKSIPDWLHARDGYLPKPDREEPARHGVIRYWKRHRVQSWINSRRGSASSPGRPKQRAEPGGEA